jgi:RNA polymerase sigma-54 factor
MALTPKLELRQTQGLVMTPQLQQAIKLLQMSNFELQSFVAAELERNPLLEREEDSDAQSTPSEQPQGAGQDEGETGGAEHQPDTFEEESRTDEPAIPGPNDSGWSNLSGASGGSFNRSEDFEFASTVSREITLQEHLTQQLHLNIADAGDRMIGGFLIGMVDETGYLSGDIDAVAATLGARVEDVERVLLSLQQFDPPGVCARNLQECLELQLKEAGRFDPIMAKFVANLHLLARRDFVGLQKICRAEAEEITDMVQEVRALNPKPGNAFGSLIVQPMVPDIFVRPAPDGTWLVELNSETLPKVLVNQQYLAKISRGNRDEDRVYLSECLSSAQWLVKSLDQRARTILKVAREIVRQQDGFLVEGVQKLKPLNLKTVAEAISMHESTVSRVTANKSMATPRGTFELKYFFTSAIGATEGGADQHSSEAVRHRIKAEGASGVLSDDLIVARLQKEGIEIARRTVAKYREALGIPSSVQRRREKRIRSRPQ